MIFDVIIYDLVSKNMKKNTFLDKNSNSNFT